ncbi:MAG: DUF721 domain-containing protein [Deltaproteobacteria bacterium]|nr:DUF721 domain-containing protein [Deltaproteobacteria bacterium]
MSLTSASSVLSNVLSRLDGQDRASLSPLWKNWTEVLGPGLSDLAKPLGHSHTTLIVGADDGMVLNELTYMSPEILDRVNAFFGDRRFDKVKVELLHGKTPLNEIRIDSPDCRIIHTRPPNLRALPETIPEDSLAARAYHKYKALFDRLDTSRKMDLEGARPGSRTETDKEHS